MPKDKVTVRELINILIEHNPDDIIIIRNIKGKRLHNVTINVRNFYDNNVDGLGCLFG